MVYRVSVNKSKQYIFSVDGNLTDIVEYSMDFKDWIVTNSFTVPNCVLSIIVDCIKDQGIEEQDYQPHSHFLPIENDKKEFLEVSDVPKEVRKAMFNLRYFRIYPHENQEGFGETW